MLRRGQGPVQHRQIEPPSAARSLDTFTGRLSHIISAYFIFNVTW